MKKKKEKNEVMEKNFISNTTIISNTFRVVFL